MKLNRNKTFATLIAFLLISTLTASISPMFTAKAHSPQWSIPTWVYVVPAPLHCMLGISMTFVMWLTLMPPGSSVTNDWNWRGIKLTLTKPSGATEVLGGTTGFTTDSTGSTYTSYVPDEIGNWTVRVDFPGQLYGVNPAIPDWKHPKLCILQRHIPSKQFHNHILLCNKNHSR